MLSRQRMTLPSRLSSAFSSSKRISLPQVFGVRLPRPMRFGATLLTLLSLLLTYSRGRAQDSAPSEYQLKAAFIFNFAKFVEWPPTAFSDAKSPFVVGVLGENPFSTDLERALHDKTLNRRPMKAVECRTLAEAKKCHIVFISASEKTRIREILKDLGPTNILTVSDADGFIESGGMIAFYREGNKIRFEINDQTAKKAGLKIDSRLLGLGKKPSN